VATGIEISCQTGAIATYEFELPPVVPPTVDEQIAAIEAKYEAKFAILRNRVSTVLLADGADQETKLASIQTEFADQCDLMNLEILDILGGVE